MSFPSAPKNVAAGQSHEDALLAAAQTDTPLGFAAIEAVVETIGQSNQLMAIKKHLEAIGIANTALRSVKRGQGCKVDFDPLSPTGQQIARLMTDAMRPLLAQHFGCQFGFANCCGIIASTDAGDVAFTPKEQIDWQHSIDC